MATRISSGWVPSMSITFFGPFPAGAPLPPAPRPPPGASPAPFSLRSRRFRGLRGFPGLRPGLLLSGLRFDVRSFGYTGRFLPDRPFLPPFPPAVRLAPPPLPHGDPRSPLRRRAEQERRSPSSGAGPVSSTCVSFSLPSSDSSSCAAPPLRGGPSPALRAPPPAAPALPRRASH